MRTDKGRDLSQRTVSVGWGVIHDQGGVSRD